MNEEQKIQELMKPRFKLVCDYPGNDNGVGDIYTYNDKEGNRGYMTEKEWCGCFTRYPSIFQKLEWWQEREKSDILSVKYIKDRANRVYELIGWDIDGDVINALMSIAPYVVNVPHLFPATQKEYEDYIKPASR